MNSDQVEETGLLYMYVFCVLDRLNSESGMLLKIKRDTRIVFESS